MYIFHLKLDKSPATHKKSFRKKMSGIVLFEVKFCSFTNNFKLQIKPLKPVKYFLNTMYVTTLHSLKSCYFLIAVYNSDKHNLGLIRRDGLRIEYERMKNDLGLSKKTKQVDVLKKAVSELQVRSFNNTYEHAVKHSYQLLYVLNQFYQLIN